MWRVYAEKWRKSENTFKKDWKKAQEGFIEWQKSINEKVIEELADFEVEERKNKVLNKIEALAILSKIARGDIEDGGRPKSNRDRISAISELARLEGWATPSKIQLEGGDNPIKVESGFLSPEEEVRYLQFLENEYNIKSEK